jgi:hypothetical protein
MISPFVFGAKNRQKARVPKFYSENLFFFLEMNSPDCLRSFLRSESPYVCMPSAYSFNVPDQNYGQLVKL